MMMTVARNVVAGARKELAAGPLPSGISVARRTNVRHLAAGKSLKGVVFGVGGGVLPAFHLQPRRFVW